MQTLQAQSLASLKQVGHWQANLQLGFAQKKHKSVLAKKLHTGPYTVQRAFYPEGDDCCHMLILHPPGGMVNGDQLNLNIDCEANAHAFITTPSANKVYQCDNQAAVQNQYFSVAESARLEYLPQEVILFDGSLSIMDTQIRLNKDSAYIGWETITFGRLASEDFFTSGHSQQKLSIFRDDKLVFVERFAAKADDELMKSTWGLNGLTNMSYMVITSEDKDLLDEIQSQVTEFNCANADQALAAVTQLNAIIHVRVLSDDVLMNKSLLEKTWQLARPRVMKKAPRTPRIWLT